MCKIIKKSEKGFTLIELLAVIIILGILMIIAIPSVTSYINSSRKSGYVSTIKELVGGARNIVNDGKIKPYDTSVTYYMPGKCIPTENANKSPYGEFEASYIIFNYTGSGYVYYWKGVDSNGMGIREAKLVDQIDTEDIASDLPLSDVDYFVPIDGRTKVGVMNDSCSEFTPEDYTYRFTPQYTYAATCTTGEAFTCDPSTYGQSYVSNCEANTYHFSMTSSSRTQMGSGGTCSGSGTSFTCNSSTLGQSYTTASVQPQTSISYDTVPSCSNSGSTACNQSTGSHTAYVCQTPVYSYYWGNSTTSSASSCTPHTSSCNESLYNSSNPYYITCSPNYSYQFGTETTSTSSSCTPNSVSSCNESVYNSGNIINVTCVTQYSYHLSNTPTTTTNVTSCSDTYTSGVSECNNTSGPAYLGKSYVRCSYNSSTGTYTKRVYKCERTLTGYKRTTKTCLRNQSGYQKTQRQCIRQINGYKRMVYRCEVYCAKNTQTCKKEYKITKQYCTK